jgi:hypothetical protein
MPEEGSEGETSGDSATDASDAEDGDHEAGSARPHSRKAVAKAQAAYLDILEGAHTRPALLWS